MKKESSGKLDEERAKWTGSVERYFAGLSGDCARTAVSENMKTASNSLESKFPIDEKKTHHSDSETNIDPDLDITFSCLNSSICSLENVSKNAALLLL